MIVLDKSRIPTDKREDPRLAAIGKSCCDAMQDPKYRLQVCLHEAAHAIYIRRAGATSLTYYGPVALYDAAKDEFDIGSAGIQPTWSESVRLPIRLVARWYVAGGVAKRLLTDDSDVGDGRDFEMFADHSREYQREEIKREWEEAQKDVEKDLRDPSFRKEVWNLAREFEESLLEGCNG